MKNTLARKEEHIVILDANEIPSEAINKLSALGKLNLQNINHPQNEKMLKNILKKLLFCGWL